VTVFSCSENRDNFDLNYPDYFPDPHYTFENNPITQDKFELGRKLFHDPVLSRDSTVSCATCHAQGHAFADHNVAVSTGIENRLGNRNSPSIVNIAWQTSFMWDGGINHIEVMPLAPITNETEMDEDMSRLIARLNRNTKYKTMFSNAFGKSKIESQQVFFALAQYMSFLVSSDSKYDKVRQGKSEFTQDESTGYQVFLAKCNSCHKEPLFTDYSFRNNGLSYQEDDPGRYRITLSENDKHTFKVPTLRNIVLTYPYMHDGQIPDLMAVLDHYDHGMMPHKNLDPVFINEGRAGIRLTHEEKTSLLAFLKTLTDSSFLSNPKFSE